MFCFAVLFSNVASAQSPVVSKIIGEIDYQQDTLLAVFDWITDNIKYDVAKLKELKKGVSFYQKGNFKNRQDYERSLIENTAKRKKGICQDYTFLFNAIIKELGYDAHIITGVTKRKGRKEISEVGHTWMAVKVDQQWKLIDPTWGAGQVKDGRTFVKKYGAQWYDTHPTEMIKTHYPHDPMWQLLSNPLSLYEFKKSATVGTEPEIDYNSTITNYLQLTKKERPIDELSRITKENTAAKPMRDHVKYLKSQIQGDEVPALFQAGKQAHDEVGEYYEQGKNKRFQGSKWTKEYSKSRLTELDSNITDLIVKLKAVKTSDPRNKQALKRTITQSRSLSKRIKKELKFLGN